MSTVTKLEEVQRSLRVCQSCPNMVGPVVHGPPVDSRIYLVGQAPGPHEGALKKPFAWTAGKTLFKWLHKSSGWLEDECRERIFFSAVARCFPGKAKSGGDRKPDDTEIHNCQRWIVSETKILKPKLVIPVGSLAISQVLGKEGPLKEVVGQKLTTTFHGHEVDVVCLPHPSGASTWHRTEPGIGLLEKALKLLSVELQKH